MTKTVNWKKNAWTLWFSQMLAFAGYAGIIPFMPLYIRDRFMIADIALRGEWVSAVNFFGMISFCFSNPLWGALSDRVGRKIMLLRASFCNALLFPLFAVVPNLYCLVALRFVICMFSGTTSAAQTLIATNTPEKHQGFALGLFSSAVWSGSMIGYLFGSMSVDRFGYVCGFSCCGALYLISGFIVLALVDENFTPPEKTAGRRPRLSWRLDLLAWTILGLFLLLGLTRRFDEPYLSLLVEQITDISETIRATGAISAMAALGGIVAGVVVGRLCDRFDPMAVLFPMIGISIASLIGESLATDTAFLAACRFAAYFGAGGLDPVYLKLLSGAVTREKRGAAFGLSMSMKMLGFVLAAGCGWLVIGAMGDPRMIFRAAALLTALNIPVALWIMRQRSRRSGTLPGLEPKK